MPKQSKKYYLLSTFFLVFLVLLFYKSKIVNINKPKAIPFTKVLKISKDNLISKNREISDPKASTSNENMYCDYYDYVSSEDLKRSEDLIMSIVPAPGFIGDKNINLSVLLTLNNQVLEDSHNEVEVFYSMLLKANLLDGINYQESKLEEALYFANLLIDKGHENSLYYILRAMIKEQLLFSKEDILLDVRKAISIKTFDSYTTKLTQEIVKRGLNDKNAFLHSQNLIANLPILEYGKITRFIRNIIDSEDVEFSKKIISWSPILMNNGLKYSKYDNSELLLWLAIEYEVGRSVYSRAFSKAYPNDENKIAKLSYKELLKKYSNSYYKKYSNCDDKLRDHFDSVKSIMTKFNSIE